MVARQYMTALITRGGFQQIKKQKRLLDPTFRNPLGNNLLHYSVQHEDIEVFYYIAEIFPELINEPNLDQTTPVHRLLSMNYRARLLDWNRFWNLPIKFSKKNLGQDTCLTILQKESHAPEAFEALIKNEQAWSKARKYHKRKTLLTHAVTKMIIEWKTGDTDPSSELPNKVEFFIKNGTFTITIRLGLPMLMHTWRCRCQYSSSWRQIVDQYRNPTRALSDGPSIAQFRY
jgi:hypothetical protein